MIIKRHLRIIFFTFILIIMIGLIVIVFQDNKLIPVINETVEDYVILNKNSESCEDKELVLTDSEYNYYCYCYKNIYVEWNNGKINLLKDEIDNNRITINSLKQHGLEIISEKIENED